MSSFILLCLALEFCSFHYLNVIGVFVDFLELNNFSMLAEVISSSRIQFVLQGLAAMGNVMMKIKSGCRPCCKLISLALVLVMQQSYYFYHCLQQLNY